MYVETIFKMRCPACAAVNYVDAGDMDDLTGVDIEGVVCHACKHAFSLTGEEAEGGRYEKGRPTA